MTPSFDPSKIIIHYLEKLNAALQRKIDSRVTTLTITSHDMQRSKFTSELSDGVAKVYEKVYDRLADRDLKRPAEETKETDAFEAPEEFREYLEGIEDDASPNSEIEQVIAITQCNNTVVAFILGVFHKETRVFSLWYFMKHVQLVNGKLQEQLKSKTPRGLSLATEATICELLRFLIEKRSVRAIVFEVSKSEKDHKKVSRLELFQGIRNALTASFLPQETAVQWNSIDIRLCDFKYRCPNYGSNVNRSVDLHFNVIPFTGDLIQAFAGDDVDKHVLREIVNAVYQCYTLSCEPETDEYNNSSASAMELLEEFDSPRTPEQISLIAYKRVE